MVQGPPHAPVHAARAGAWTLALAALLELTAGLVTAWARVQTWQGDDAWERRERWLRTLDALDGGSTVLQLVLLALLVDGLASVRRGTGDRGARALLLAAAVLVPTRLIMPVAQHLFGVRGDYDAWGFATPWEVFFDRLHWLRLGCERATTLLVLAALALARRAWGLGPGRALTVALAVFVVHLAAIAAINLGWWQFDGGDPSAYATFEATVYALVALDVAALVAALVAFARAAPPDAIAARWTAASRGLLTYRSATLTKLAVLLGGYALLMLGALLGLPRRPGLWLLLAISGLGLVAGLGQIVGLVRYNDAPAPIARPALVFALVGAGVGLLAECVALALLATFAAADPTAFGSRLPSPATLAWVEGVAQISALLGVAGLLASLRRAALSVGATALEDRIVGLGAATVTLAVVAYIVRSGIAAARGDAAWQWLIAAALLLAGAVAVFVGAVRVLAGLASAMADAGRLSPGSAGLTAAPAARDDAAHDPR